MGSSSSKPQPTTTRSEEKYFADPPQANFSAPISELGKRGKVEPGVPAAVAGTTAAATTDAAALEVTAFQRYSKFRDELLSFSLGESAFDFAERLYKESPHSPDAMALLAETTTLYDKVKNKHQRKHWVDRLDLLQRGIDVSRKCIKEHPDFGPCYRTYVMCAVRASESLYYYRWMQSVGLLENYSAIVKRGEQGLKLCPDDPEIPKALGALSCRCAYHWYNPYRVLGWIYGVPGEKTLYANGIKYLKMSADADPSCLETACRLGMAYFHAGDFANARRWYVKVRDEMPPQDLKDERWQSIAHTALSTNFVKPRWNVPFA